ncbi:MAG TPA: phospholipase D family protein [Opitutaceae bacterium]|nr:phospholipase D family protein [Opitutaceae bacterium]
MKPFLPFRLRRLVRLGAWGALPALLGGCLSPGVRPAPAPSFALARPEDTRLGAALAGSERLHPGRSGFALLDYGLEALLARIAAADAAERTLDVQCYIYDRDPAGEVLTRHLLEAADRGVRVRLLLDDFNFEAGRRLAALDEHPRIEVRIFNPVSRRGPWPRLLAYALHFHRADRRMHDKVFVADNEVAILGGRNIGGDYFNLGAKRPFRDFDLLGAGPVAAEASAVFDRFWNSPWAVPAAVVTGRAPAPGDLAWLRRRLASPSAPAAWFEERYVDSGRSYRDSFASDRNTLVWAEGEIVSDPPAKAGESDPSLDPVARRFTEEWARARREVLLEQAYFLPGADGALDFPDFRATGAAVRVLTSGPDTTDVPLVYGAYHVARRQLLEEGVELHEFRKQPPRSPPGNPWFRVRPAYAALHSKVAVFDRQVAWIGTFNLDPRSVRLNTEIAAVIRSPELSRRLAAAIVDDFSPERSWRVQLGREAGSRPVVLTGEVGGRMVVRRSQAVGLWRRLEVFLFSLIPEIRDQL